MTASSLPDPYLYMASHRGFSHRHRCHPTPAPMARGIGGKGLGPTPPALSSGWSGWSGGGAEVAKAGDERGGSFSTGLVLLGF